MGLLTGDEETINSLLDDIEVLKKALGVFANKLNWRPYIEADYSVPVEWVGGSIAPWMIAQRALRETEE